MNRPILPTDSGSPPIDGRTARRDRGRIAVLEAALELFEEENLEPNPEQIAQRAGVSTRSVYRYFEDREELVRAVIAHQQLKVLPMFHIENIGLGDLSSRISRLVDSRLRVYDAIGATARAMTIKAASDPVIGEQVRFRKSVFREQIDVNFAQEFEQMTPTQHSKSLNAIDVIAQAESLDRFQVDLDLSVAETRELLATSIAALLKISK